MAVGRGGRRLRARARRLGGDLLVERGGRRAPGLGAFREFPYMGVIHVVAEAAKLGFRNGHPDRCNLGQGQPEVGEMEGAPPRIRGFEIEPGDRAYGPVDGGDALRRAVADHYDRLSRRGKASRYGPENVSVASGGRLGHQVPDYTAYEDMIGYNLDRLTAVAIHAPEGEGFRIPPEPPRARGGRPWTRRLRALQPLQPDRLRRPRRRSSTG